MIRLLRLGSLAVVVAAAAAASARADSESVRRDLEVRYGIEVDLKRYPQGDPQQAIRSVIQAAVASDVEYLLAQLISPAQVDQKLGGSRGEFRKLVAKATPEKSRKMAEALGKQLREGTWIIRRNAARAEVDGVPDLSLEKLGGRWFMHNTPTSIPENR